MSRAHGRAGATMSMAVGRSRTSMSSTALVHPVHRMSREAGRRSGDVHGGRPFPNIDAIELQELVQTIADGVLNPDDRPLCKK